MKNTIEPALSDSPLDERPERVGKALNKDIVPVVKALRAFANYTGVEKKTASTAGAGVFVRLWTSAEMPSDACWMVLASVAGTGSTAGGTQHAGYLIAATFQAQAATVTQTGSTTVLVSHESDAAIDCRYGVDSANRQVYVEVRDAGTAAMSFTAVVEVTESAV